MKLHKILMALALAGVMTIRVSPLLAQENTGHGTSYLPEVFHDGRISYTTGGIGQRETDAMKVTDRDYNLIVSNAIKSGAYTTADALTITNKQNHRQVLKVTKIGPLFYAELPPGSYLVQAYSDSVKSERTIDVTGRNQDRIHFIWPD